MCTVRVFSYTVAEYNRLIVALVFTFPDKCYTIHVSLRAPRYVLVNGTASLDCYYDVDENSIHKVEWLRGGNKIYQYIKGRNPPYNNFSIAGAEIDVSTFHCIVTINIPLWLIV